MSSISNFSLKLKEKTLTLSIDLNNSACIGKKGKVILYLETQVLHSSPVNKKKVLKEIEMEVPSEKFHMDLDISSIEAYSYKGKSLNIDCKICFTVDDSLLFDSKVEEKILQDIFQKPKVNDSAKEILDPRDSFNFLKNLKVISGGDRLIVLGAMFVGAGIVLLNTYIGWHDQMSPDYATYIYSHTNSDGETSSPFFDSLYGSGAAGVAVWLFIRNRLRRYMTFVLQKVDFRDEASIFYRTSELMSGKTRCDLENATFRIVAGNIEKAQHKETRGSGKNRRTVTVSTNIPVRAVVLHEQKIDFIPKGANIENYLSGQFSFGKMHSVLYPELQVSSNHGLFLHWEAQLLVDEYIDQECICPTDFFQYKNFLKS